VGEGRETRSNHQNRIAAFKRLIETPKFKTWHKTEVARRMGGSPEVESQIRNDAAFGASKIRSYNFKRMVATDHRSGKDYPLADVMDGKIDPIIRDLARLRVQI
jgi:protein subunit release factor A